MSRTKIFGWNVRGLNKPKRQRLVREWILSSGSQLGAILETHVQEDRANLIAQRIMPAWRLVSNYDTAVIGRIWLMWDPSEISILVYATTAQKIICSVTNVYSQEKFTLVIIYASNDLDTRTQLWEELTAFSQDARLRNLPWAVIGDFNQIASLSEYYSERRVTPSYQGIRAFQSCLTDSHLFDLPFSGVQYTWTNRQPRNTVTKKLDRVLITDTWLLRFPFSHAIFEASGVSDHARYILHLGADMRRSKSAFKYFSFLANHESFLPSIQEHWNSEVAVGSNMFQFVYKRKGLKPILRALNRNNYHQIEHQTSQAKDHLQRLQTELMTNPSANLSEQESLAHKAWSHLADIEEQFYKQKSRIKWLREGDSNSKFFHREVISRQANNRIRCLLDSAGHRISDTTTIKTMVLDYYKALLGSANEALTVISVSQLQQLLQFRCSRELCTSLSSPPSTSDIKEIIFGMAKNRAPGPDGFPIDFYHHSWTITGPDIVAAIAEFFTSGSILREINATSISLIPKIRGAEKLSDFRPISCCNATYKIISTILARKLGVFLSEAVQRNQVGFVKGRLLAENVLLASELVTGFHKSGPTTRGCLKVDLAKAYDNVSWKFILNILRAIDAPSQLLHWIKICITTPYYSVNLNGELVGFFPGKKGLRQGDPLSSSLFVLVMDTLSKMLDFGAQEGRIRLHRSCKRPLITHLSFADDLLVFFDGSSSSLQGILDIFEEFYQTSGLRMNCEKTALFLDGNDDELLSSMADRFGIVKGSLPVRYLGLPLSPRGIKIHDYQILIDRTRQRVQSWKVRHLSFAGRLQLVRSVLNSLINFWLSVFILPKQCLSRLERICKSFLWKGDDSLAKGAKISWDSVCKPKEEGGLGLRRLTVWNSIFGLKLLWMLFSNAGSLWVAWAKSHLIKNGYLFSPQYTLKGSLQWRKLLKLRRIAADFLSCRIYSGSTVSFWYDCWLPQGILISLVGVNGPALSGIRSLSSVNQAIINNHWDISTTSRNPTVLLLRSILPANPPPLDHSQADQFTWRSSATTFSTSFSTRSTWKLLKPHTIKVPWFKAVWIKPSIPKHSFLFWILVWGRLPTKDRMLGWGIDVNADCVLCRSAIETADHLFVNCDFVQLIWQQLLFVSARGIWNSVNMMVNWSLSRKGNKEQVQIERLLIQDTVYEIWRERNSRIHLRTSSTQLTIVKGIRRTIRNKLSAGPYSYSPSIASLPLLQKWFQVFQSSSPPLIP